MTTTIEELDEARSALADAEARAERVRQMIVTGSAPYDESQPEPTAHGGAHARSPLAIPSKDEMAAARATADAWSARVAALEAKRAWEDEEIAKHTELEAGHAKLLGEVRAAAGAESMALIAALNQAHAALRALVAAADHRNGVLRSQAARLLEHDLLLSADVEFANGATKNGAAVRVNDLMHWPVNPGDAVAWAARKALQRNEQVSPLLLAALGQVGRLPAFERLNADLLVQVRT